MGIFGRLIFILCAALAGPFPAAQEIPVVEFSVSEFVVTGDNPLPPKDSDAILAEFVGTYSGLDGLLGAVDALQARLNEAGFAFRRVILPP